LAPPKLANSRLSCGAGDTQLAAWSQDLQQTSLRGRGMVFECLCPAADDRWAGDEKGSTMAKATGSGTVEKSPAIGTTASGATKMPDQQRDEVASKLVDRCSLWSGGVGLIPVPLLDIAALGGVQLNMLRRLSEIYGVPFSENIGKSVIASLTGSVIPASAATTAAIGVASVLKSLPAIGTMVGALTMPVFSAGATYVIGKFFIQHFASGGTLLDFNPPGYREFIKAQKAKDGHEVVARGVADTEPVACEQANEAARKAKLID